MKLRTLLRLLDREEDADKEVLFNVFIDDQEVIMELDGVSDATSIIGIELRIKSA